MANMFDFNQVGKDVINKNKKYEKQTNEYLTKYTAQLREEQEQENKKKDNSALSSARFAYGSTYARSKNRIANLQETVTYENRTAITGMTEMVSEIVEKALLLDEEEFSKVNPGYKEEIRERVRGFLENANINQDIKNKDTLAIMEYVYNRLPDAASGKYLTEEDISRLLQLQKPVEIENSIRNLSGDVSSRVAELVESEQKRVKETNKKLKDAKVEKDEAPVAAEEEVVEEPVEEEIPEEDVVDAPVNGTEVVAEPVIKKQIQMLPDGTININMLENEETLTEDHITKRLGFGFTKNQKYDDDMMIGKATGDIKNNLGPILLSLIPYVGLPAGVVAIIRAVKNSEAIDSSKMEALKKLVYSDARCKKVLDEIHKELLKNQPDGKKLKVYRNEFQDEVRRVKREAAGEQLTECLDMIINYQEETPVIAESFVRETPRTGLLESLAVNEAFNMLKEGKEYNSDLCLANALMYVTITEAMDTLGLMHVDSKIYSNIISAAGGNVISESNRTPFQVDRKEVEAAPKKVVSAKANLQESFVTQWKAPLSTSSYDGLAERIRKRTLEKMNNKSTPDILG